MKPGERPPASPSNDGRLLDGTWGDPVPSLSWSARFLFYLIDRFVQDGRLANLLKILVALICLAAILQRLLPAFDINLF